MTLKSPMIAMGTTVVAAFVMGQAVSVHFDTNGVDVNVRPKDANAEPLIGPVTYDTNSNLNPYWITVCANERIQAHGKYLVTLVGDSSANIAGPYLLEGVKCNQHSNNKNVTMNQKDLDALIREEGGTHNRSIDLVYAPLSNKIVKLLALALKTSPEPKSE